MIGKTNAISGVSDPVPKIKTVSGSVISVSDALAMPAVSLAVDIDAVQDLHGYANPWPAGGGKNICPNTGWVQGQIQTNGNISPHNYSISSDYIYLTAGTYTAWRSYSGVDGQLAYHTYDLDKVHLSDSGWETNPFAIVVTNPIYIRFTTRLDVSTPLSPSDIDSSFKIQLEKGSTATSYVPYANICPISGWSNVNVYREAQYDAGATPYATINLNGTVYGGSLDVTTGVLTVTHGIVDATTIGWTKASDQDNPNGTYYLLSNVSVPFVGWNNGGSASAKSNALVKSDTGIQTTSSANTFWWNIASTGWRAIWGIANGGSTLAEFTQFLSDNNVVFYGELATPQTVQLSPTAVQMLAGNNALWADSGDSELQYWARR